MARFEELYRRDAGRVVGFVVRRCWRPEEVRDLVAAVWLEVIASADRFDPSRGKAVPWLLGVAANVTASDARRRAREREATDRLAGRLVLDNDDYVRLEREIDAAAIAPEIRAALAGLPPGERTTASCKEVHPQCTSERLPNATLTGDQTRRPLQSVDGFSLEGLIIDPDVSH